MNTFLWVMLLLLVVFVPFFVVYIYKKMKFNNGICKICGGEWEHINDYYEDSNYKCPDCGNKMENFLVFWETIKERDERVRKEKIKADKIAKLREMRGLD